VAVRLLSDVSNGVDWAKTFLDCLNLITVAVPPALPLALSIGTSVALSRLKSFGIFCSDATRISAAGRVNCLCFDKTGTLTTDGLTLKGLHYVLEHDAGAAESKGGDARRTLGAMLTEVRPCSSQNKGLAGPCVCLN
jgi:P-type E1-E2 ATPase